MTLDEWKAQEDAKRAKADFNIRKPGEGCNGDPQWTRMVVLTKKEKTEGVEEEEDLVPVLQCYFSFTVFSLTFLGLSQCLSVRLSVHKNQFFSILNKI